MSHRVKARKPNAIVELYAERAARDSGACLAFALSARTGGMGKEPGSDYLDRLMRRGSFAALWPLFSKATRPAKEMTESFSALEHLRPLMKSVGLARVIHVGDGAHARTAALFALKTNAENISVDPIINERIVGAWRDEFSVERFAWIKSRISDAAHSLNALPRLPVFVTFVHAHVDVDAELSLLRWDAAFALSCCVPGKQLTRAYVPRLDAEDPQILSADRRVQVLVNPQSRFLA